MGKRSRTWCVRQLNRVVAAAVFPLVLGLSIPHAALGAQESPAAQLAAGDLWTDSLDFPLPDGRRGWGWTWRHEDQNKALCKPVRGETLLLDEQVKTAGKASIRCRYKAAEARQIRADIPPPTPRQIYNVLSLPDPPVDASGYDAVEFDIRSAPDGAVTAIRVLVQQRDADGTPVLLTAGDSRFRVGTDWRRFGVYLRDMTDIRKSAPADWARCTQLVIDVRLAMDALEASEFTQIWLDGLRFVKGISAAADAAIAAASQPRPSQAETFPEAPVLRWEDLGVMVRGRTTLRGSPGLGFSTDKDGWSAYMGYRDHIVKRKPWAFVEVNLQNGKVKRFQAPEEELTDAWAFRVFPDGRPYTLPTGSAAAAGARIARIDWRTGQLEVFGPCPDPWNYCWQWGANDDAIYIGGYRKGHAIRFDPETAQITDYGVQGPPDAVHALDIAADDKFVYTCVGKNTSYLIACDKQTREQHILRSAEYPGRWSVNSWDGQVFPRLHPPTYEDGVPKWQEFRVRHCRMEPMPQRPERQTPGPRAAFGVPRPELLSTSAMCLGDGYATLWYRLPEQDWQSIRFQVDDVPSYLFRLGVTADGRIIGASEDPYTIFTYDPETGGKRLLGPPPNLTHVYSFLAHPNGNVYMCGYSGAPLFAWNPTQPWTYQPGTPDKATPNAKDPKCSPTQVARIYRQRRAFKALLGADGRIYIPCSAYVETLPGGCLGWYDPARDEAGLIREGFETWRGNDGCTAADGRYIVVTTVPWPPDQGEKETVLTDPHDLIGTADGMKIRYRGPEGATGTRITADAVVRKLLAGRTSRSVSFDQTGYVVTFDTSTQKVIGQLPLASPTGSTRDVAMVCEWEPGSVIVRVNTAAGAKYGLLNVAEQKIEFPLTLPGPGRGKLLRLPGGHIAALHRGAIVLLDPSDWTWRVAGRLRPIEDGKPLEPRDWVLLDDDLYLCCETRLGRISSVSRLGSQ